MARKRKTLPKDFEERLKKGNLAELTAVFDTCELTATGGYSKHTAIGFLDCPDDLIRWLVDQGLDVDTPDSHQRTPFSDRCSLGRVAQLGLLLELGADLERADYQGSTPLHTAAGRHKPQAVAFLIKAGADVTGGPAAPTSPLEWCLKTTRNTDIPSTADIAELLLAAGATTTPEMADEVRRIGADFEFHRGGFNPDYLAETDAGLARLYALFGVDAVAPRRLHDGTSPIEVPDGSVAEQFEALWELLVPSSGAAATVQGEVVRVAGRVRDEIDRNGGANWDKAYRNMLAFLVETLASGDPLPADDVAEAQALGRRLSGGDGDADELDRLADLATAWVLRNPVPAPLPKPGYRR